MLELVYDRRSPVGQLDEPLDETTATGWTVVDMKPCWENVLRFES
jgi:hypothetical protein